MHFFSEQSKCDNLNKKFTNKCNDLNSVLCKYSDKRRFDESI